MFELNCMDYRELEIYTGNTDLVYVDRRENLFLEDATVSLLECRDSSVTSSSPSPAVCPFLFIQFTLQMSKGKINLMLQRKRDQ